MKVEAVSWQLPFVGSFVLSAHEVDAESSRMSIVELGEIRPRVFCTLRPSLQLVIASAVFDLTFPLRSV